MDIDNILSNFHLTYPKEKGFFMHVYFKKCELMNAESFTASIVHYKFPTDQIIK